MGGKKPVGADPTRGSCRSRRGRHEARPAERQTGSTGHNHGHSSGQSHEEFSLFSSFWILGASKLAGHSQGIQGVQSVSSSSSGFSGFSAFKEICPLSPPSPPPLSPTRSFISPTPSCDEDRSSDKSCDYKHLASRIDQVFDTLRVLEEKIQTLTIALGDKESKTNSNFNSSNTSIPTLNSNNNSTAFDFAKIVDRISTLEGRHAVVQSKMSHLDIAMGGSNSLSWSKNSKKLAEVIQTNPNPTTNPTANQNISSTSEQNQNNVEAEKNVENFNNNENGIDNSGDLDDYAAKKRNRRKKKKNPSVGMPCDQMGYVDYPSNDMNYMNGNHHHNHNNNYCQNREMVIQNFPYNYNQVQQPPLPFYQGMNQPGFNYSNGGEYHHQDFQDMSNSNNGTIMGMQVMCMYGQQTPAGQIPTNLNPLNNCNLNNSPASMMIPPFALAHQQAIYQQMTNMTYPQNNNNNNNNNSGEYQMAGMRFQQLKEVEDEDEDEEDDNNDQSLITLQQLQQPESVR